MLSFLWPDLSVFFANILPSRNDHFIRVIITYVWAQIPNMCIKCWFTHSCYYGNSASSRRTRFPLVRVEKHLLHLIGKLLLRVLNTLLFGTSIPCICRKQYSRGGYSSRILVQLYEGKIVVTSYRYLLSNVETTLLPSAILDLSPISTIHSVRRQERCISKRC